MQKGIDISRHQGVIDWGRVKNDGIEFAILRAGYGKSISQKDERFERNYTGCIGNDIHVGAYWYSYAVTEEEAQLEAEACLRSIAGKKFAYPIYFDIEDKTQSGLSRQQLEAITATFCERLERAGYWVGIYSYKAFLESKFSEDFLKRYAVWVAHTGVTETNFKYAYGIWQYSHTGTIKGIQSDVDLDYCYRDYPTMMKKAGLNGYEETGASYTEHVVTKNETLWGIAEKYLGSGERYPEIKQLNDLQSDKIIPGQVLKIPEK